MTPTRDPIRTEIASHDDALIDVHTHVGVSLASYMTEGYPYCQSAVDLHGRLTALGFGYWVAFDMLSPAVFTLNGYRRNELTPSGDESEPPFAFENHRLMVEVYDLLEHLADRFLCFAAVDPERRPDAQVRALTELNSSYPVRGLKVGGTLIRSRTIELLGTGQRLLDWAAERDVPVMMHSAVHPDDPWSQVSDLLEVAQQRPEIRFCVAHTARFDRPCLEGVAELDNCWFDTSAFGIHCALAVQDHPSVARADRRFAADYAGPPGVLASLYEAFPDKMLWGSDSPFESYSVRHRHADGRLETYRLMSDVQTEAGYLRSLPADAVRRIAHENTLRFLFGCEG